MAQWTAEDRVHVWTHSQGVYLLRADLALVLKLPVENITVEHMEGAGCYGHNAADDVALDAVLLARAAGGRPVRVQWSREDEMSHAPFGAAMAIEIEADLDARDEIVGWRHSIWSNGHAARPGRAAQPALLAATELANPFPRMISTNPPQANGGGGDRNSIPLYDFPSWQIESHRLTDHADPHLRAADAGRAGQRVCDRILSRRTGHRARRRSGRFRLRHLSDERAKDVIRAAAKRANWKPAKRAGVGYGLGFARYKNTGAYCAVIAEVEGAEDISVRRLTIAVDVGEAINPDGVINQIEGGAIQATSWVLKERVRFDRQRITSTSWEAYPILRFSEVPDVQVELIQRPDSEPLGAGEAAHGPVTAAIANAVFDALGVRVRNLPITRDSLIAAMELSLMSALNILSGGAAQGLVASLAPKFKVQTGLDIAGEFGAVGAMADKLRNGTPADIVILTSAIVAKLARRELGRPRLDIRYRPGRNRRRRPRRRSAGHGQGCGNACAMRCSRRTRSSFPTPRRRPPGFMSQKCCSNSASPTRWLPGSEFFRTARPRCDIWRTPTRTRRSAARNRPRSSARGRDPVGITAAGLRTRDHVYGGRDRAGRQLRSRRS